MSGAVVVRYLLANSAPLTAMVPASRIKAEEVTQGAALPAIELIDISARRREPVAAAPSYLYTSRIQINVLAATSALRETILNLVMDALPRTRGVVNGVNVDSVMYESHGPKSKDPETKIFAGSLDYFVKYTA